MFRLGVFLFGVTLFVFPFRSLFAQDTDLENSLPQLTITARSTIEDVVVMDKTGHPVPGLRKEDFQVLENGKPQAITFFEPNFTATEAATPPSTPLPNIFTNIPGAEPQNVTNVLLLDALDSWPEDQMYAQVQMVKYLASLPPHLRIGIFTLTPEKLNLIWPVNQDSSALTLALAKFASSHSSTGPTTVSQQQALLSTLNEAAQKTQDSRVADGAYALQKFLKHGPGLIQQRNHGAGEALQSLGHYLAGIPGRKNLFWIIGNFPHCEPINTCSKTMDMLGDAGISVYPIDAHGVDVDMGIGPDPDFHQAARRLIDSNAWAEYTGGKAYHTNDIKQEIADAVNHGSRYYTLAYVPLDKKEEGRERKVEIKVLSGHYDLFYRQRYFEKTRREIAESGAAPPKDPLIALMGHGMPNIGEIPYLLKVVPAATQPGAGTPRAGANVQLNGELTRYDIGFHLLPSGLSSLLPDADGTRRERLEVMVMIYSQDAKPLNWESYSTTVQIKSEQMSKAATEGVTFHFYMDSPAGDVYLRTGVYDLSQSRVGTLEIPLIAVTGARK